jgi:DNA-binding response OmpR family regulator
LSAEDDRAIARLIAHYVQREGWHAHVEPSGGAALLYARTHQVDIAILDIMPFGLVCRALRSYEATARLPHIKVTTKRARWRILVAVVSTAAWPPSWSVDTVPDVAC